MLKEATRMYAPYWRDDQTMNPVLVRYVQNHGDFYDVRFPDGHIESVHLHTLGKFHSA